MHVVNVFFIFPRPTVQQETKPTVNYGHTRIKKKNNYIEYITADFIILAINECGFVFYYIK